MVEEQQGVYIPLIDKVLLKNNVPAMSYAKFMEYAKTNRVEIATKEELLQMYSQKDEINKILKEHGGDILDNWFGSSSEHLSFYEWFVNFGSGNWSYSSKHYSYVSRAVVDLKSKKTNNMKQFNLEEYLKDPNKKVVTRDGRNVRIICTDRKGTEYSVVALCTMSNVSEDCYFYFPNGKMYLSSDSNNDLFFAPEKHEGWVNLYNLSEGPYLGSVYSSKEVAEAMSKKCGLQHYIATIKIEWEE